MADTLLDLSLLAAVFACVLGRCRWLANVGVRVRHGFCLSIDVWHAKESAATATQAATAATTAEAAATTAEAAATAAESATAAATAAKAATTNAAAADAPKLGRINRQDQVRHRVDLHDQCLLGRFFGRDHQVLRPE